MLELLVLLLLLMFSWLLLLTLLVLLLLGLVVVSCDCCWFCCPPFWLLLVLLFCWFFFLTFFVLGSLLSFFHFILRFWNQILICLSLKQSECAISILLLRVKYRLKWNSFSNSRIWCRVYAVLCLLGSMPVKPPFTFTDNHNHDDEDGDQDDDEMHTEKRLQRQAKTRKDERVFDQITLQIILQMHSFFALLNLIKRTSCSTENDKRLQLLLFFKWKLTLIDVDLLHPRIDDSRAWTLTRVRTTVSTVRRRWRIDKTSQGLRSRRRSSMKRNRRRRTWNSNWPWRVVSDRQTG